MPHPPLGFALLTHREPAQIFRLIGALNTLYDNPPIAVHHAMDQCPLDTRRVSSNVQFVAEPIPTRWGHWSLVEASLLAFRLLFSGASRPTYGVLLSGADYPLVPASRVLGDLLLQNADVYLDAEPVPRYPVVPRAESEKRWEFQKRHYRKKFEFRIPWSRPPRYRRLYLPRWASRPFVPFHEGLMPFGGSQWLNLNERALQTLLEFPRLNPKVVRFFRGVRVPDESYPHTVLLNTPGIRCVNRNYRFIEWVDWSPNPRTLLMSDLPRMIESGMHFARKFDPSVDSRVLDALDEHLGIRRPVAAGAV